MKNAIKIIAASIAFLGMLSNASAQKKRQHLVLSKEFNLPASEVWKVVGEDYGAVAKSHPKIVSSNYVNGSLVAKEGAERICNFNEKGTQYLKEKMINYDPTNMSFVNTVYQAGKFPVDPELTEALYKVEDLGNGRCRLTFNMKYRTKPAFMGSLMKGKFKGLIKDYFIAIEHHVKTGEAVTKENFKSIKKMYKV